MPTRLPRAVLLAQQMAAACPTPAPNYPCLLLWPASIAAPQVQIYDLASNKWTLGRNLPYSVGSASTALIGGYVYLCGGILESIGECA